MERVDERLRAWWVRGPAPGKRGVFLHERLVAVGSEGISVRKLGGNRAGEMRITRFLRNPSVTPAAMVEAARERLLPLCAGRHVLAIQDTTDLKTDPNGGTGLFLHPLIAADAGSGALLGLADAALLPRTGGARGLRQTRPHADKESRRWLDGIKAAASLGEAGATSVTVIADREGDVYEDFACRPDGVEVLIRAGQDRALVGGGRLFSCLDGTRAAGSFLVRLPSAPGRPAREARLEIRFRRVEIARPASRKGKEEFKRLPPSVVLSFVEAREIDPPRGQTAAHWRLLTSHEVETRKDAIRIAGFYRQRWLIEQVFRTMKTKGFDVGAVRLARNGPYENLAMVTTIAAITVLQLVRERDGEAGRPLRDALGEDDGPILAEISKSLEGKTQKQKNPHKQATLAFATWVLARLGGWTGYYGKPGPIVILNGLVRYQAIKLGWELRDV